MKRCGLKNISRQRALIFDKTFQRRQVGNVGQKDLARLLSINYICLQITLVR